MAAPNPRPWTIAQIQFQISALEERPTSVETRDRAHSLDLLSGLCGYKFEKFKILDDIEKCIALENKAIDALVPEDSNLKGHFLSRHSAWLVTKADAMGKIQDLEESLEAGDKALRELEYHTSAWWTNRNNMDSSLLGRYARLRNPADLHRAIKNQREALETEEYSNKTVVLGLLALLLRTRYELLDTLDDLEESIKMGFEALRTSGIADTVADS